MPGMTDKVVPVGRAVDLEQSFSHRGKLQKVKETELLIQLSRRNRYLQHSSQPGIYVHDTLALWTETAAVEPAFQVPGMLLCGFKVMVLQ
jgi:hypothetical protein